MSSLQYKIWKRLLKARYKRRQKHQAHELHLKQAFEMPRPPKILHRRNKIEEHKIGSHSVFSCHPEKYSSKKVIFYLHGGAYFARISLPHWLFIRKLSNRFGMKIVLPDYPTAPAYNYLQTNEFVIKAYKSILSEHDPEQIFFFGDSAGGGLALSLAQGLKQESLPQPAGLFLFSPWLDLSMTNPEIIKIEKKDLMLFTDNLKIAAELYAEDEDLKNPLISPLYGDIDGLAEINLFIGTHDILLPDCRKFRDLWNSTEVGLNYFEYPDMVHCWMLFPIPEAEEVIEKIQKLMKV